jgi:hypothetical protein
VYEVETSLKYRAFQTSCDFLIRSYIWNLFWASWMRFTLSHPIYLRSILILYSSLCLRIPVLNISWLKYCMYFSSPVCAPHVLIVSSSISWHKKMLMKNTKLAFGSWFAQRYLSHIRNVPGSNLGLRLSKWYLLSPQSLKANPVIVFQNRPRPVPSTTLPNLIYGRFNLASSHAT